MRISMFIQNILFLATISIYACIRIKHQTQKIYFWQTIVPILKSEKNEFIQTKRL